MDIETLRYFTVLGNSSSLSKAAAELSISQQGLGKAMSSLESELGVQLFTRDYSGTTLTAQGRSFLVHATHLVDYWQDAVREMRQSGEPDTLRINVAMSPHLSEVSAKSAAFTAAAFANLAVVPLDKELDILQRTEKADPQLYFVELFGNMAQSLIHDESLVFEPVLSGQLGIIANRRSSFAKKASLRLADLKMIPLGVNSGKSFAVYWKSTMNGIALPDHSFASENWEALAEYAKVIGKASLFDSCSYAIMRANDTLDGNALCFIPLAEGDCRIDVGFLYRSDATLTEEERTFIDGTIAMLRPRSTSFSAYISK